MIIELLLAPLWWLTDNIINLMPSPVISGVLDSSFFDLIARGISIIGSENFVMMLGSVIFWYGVQLVWAIVEWVYKKIPGVS